MMQLAWRRNKTTFKFRIRPAVESALFRRTGAMLKCPFCQYANEDGALFCEQCKSDLGVLEAPAPLPSAEESANFIRTMGSPAPLPEVQVARPVPVAVPVEANRSA